MTKSPRSTRFPWGQSSYGTWGSRPWTSPSLYANLHFRYTVPTPRGAEFIRDLRIKALDLSVFVRKSALQVQCTHSPWGHSSYGTWGSRPWISPSLCANLHCRYSVPTHPGVKVHTGPEDQGPGSLRLCAQICTAGTVYPLPLSQSSYGTWASWPWTSPSFYANLHCRVTVYPLSWGRVHTRPVFVQICTTNTAPE
jgi:hypothetical protein